MKSRNLRPAFFHKPPWARLSHESFRLLLGLYSMGDSQGRVHWDPDHFKHAIFAYWPDVSMKPLLLELAHADLIVVYRVKARGWIWFPAYSQLHNVHAKEAKSSCPPPPIDERLPQEPGFVPLESNAFSIAAINMLFAANSGANSEASERHGPREMSLHMESPKSPGNPMNPEMPVFASDSGLYISAFPKPDTTSRAEHRAADGRLLVDLSEEERRADLRQRMGLSSETSGDTEPVIPGGSIAQHLGEEAEACAASK